MCVISAVHYAINTMPNSVIECKNAHLNYAVLLKMSSNTVKHRWQEWKGPAGWARWTLTRVLQRLLWCAACRVTSCYLTPAVCASAPRTAPDKLNDILHPEVPYRIKCFAAGDLNQMKWSTESLLLAQPQGRWVISRFYTARLKNRHLKMTRNE